MVVLFGLCLLLPGSPLVELATGPAANDAQELTMYCAAGVRVPVEQIAEQYRQQYGVTVNIQYGGSNTLLSQLEVARQGDLFLAADESYLQLAQQKSLVDEILPLARMKPVVAVAKGNPRGIETLEQLLPLRVAIGNPDQTAIGRTTRALLQQAGEWDAFNATVQQRGVYKPTVGDVANDVSLGSVDAGIIWDAVANQHSNIDQVQLPEFAAGEALIEVGVLSSSRHPTEALRFARFLAASDRGQRVFEREGYSPVSSDPWDERPQLTVYAGSVNKRVLDSVLESFAEREGVDVNTVYNGCGILNAQLESIAAADDLYPDAYVPCDRYYLQEVADRFEGEQDVSSTPIVIVVAKGNPKNIFTLTDLHREGVRVALGQPDQCTIGVLSRKLLESEQLYEQVLADNVVTQTTSSAFLIAPITVGAADASLAYATDAMSETSKLDWIPIDSPHAKAVQQFAISRSTRHKQLAERLRQHLLDSKEIYLKAGFRWEAIAD